MFASALARRSRSAAPFAAFLATALLAIVLAAQAQLVCSHELIVTMPAMDMAGMPEMAAPSGAAQFALCPIVLILGIAAAVTTMLAFASLVSDRHRGVAGRAFARACARLPLAATIATLATLGSASVAIMMAIDRSIPAGASGWLFLAAIIAGIAASATVLAVAGARCALAFTRRIAVAIACAIGVLETAAAPAFQRRLPCRSIAHRVPALAARRGLRAPPFFVR